MTNMMKKAFSILLVVAMIMSIVPMTAFAAVGDYEEPYQLVAGGEVLRVTVEPGTEAYIQADDCNNSTVTVGYATSDGYFIQYGRQSVYPETDGTATFTMNSFSNIFFVYNSGEESVTVMMMLESGAGAGAGTMDNPEEVVFDGNWYYNDISLDYQNQGYYLKLTAPDNCAIGVTISAYDPETYDSVGWAYNVNNLTAGQYSDTFLSTDFEFGYEYVTEVSEGDEVIIMASTYDPADMWNNPAGTVTVSINVYYPGDYSYPEAVEEGDVSTYIAPDSFGYYYAYTATEDGYVTVTMNDAEGWQYNLMLEPASGIETDYYYGDMHSYNDEPVVASEEVAMYAGDKLLISVCTYDPETWSAYEGTVNWSFAFEAGEIEEEVILPGDPVAVPGTCIWSGDIVTVAPGKTVFFEIGTNGATGTYDFVVEGTGDFDVSICDEDGNGAYIAGEPVSAVDGAVETTITSFESTYGYGAFAITNNSDEVVEYTCTIDFPVGSQGNPYPVTLEMDVPVEVTVPAGTQFYVDATLPEMNVEYQLTISGNTGFGVSKGMMPTWDNNGVVITTVSTWYGPASVSIINNTLEEQTYTLVLENMPLGAESNPDTPVIGMQDATIAYDGASYYYVWTAEENGAITVTMNADEGWLYQVNVAPENVDDYSSYYYGDTHWYNDDPSVPFETVNVSAGDTVTIMVSTYDAATYSSPVGSVNWSFEFVNNVMGSALVVGENAAEVNPDYEYTVLSFEPTEDGVYTFTSDALMGIVSYNGMWVSIEPSAETVCENELVWECIDIGQSIWVAVKADADVANITVTREDRDTSGDTQWVTYENIVTPEPFEFEEDANSIVYIDVEDEINDEENVIYNEEDGFYHYGTADGPIVYVNLDDGMMSMVGVVSNGKLVAVWDAEDGSLADCTNAMMEYIACAESVETNEGTMLLYPLTYDLIIMYAACGSYMGWYGEDGWLGIDTPDVYLFACVYSEGETEVLNGWVSEDGKWAYYVDGEMVTNKWVKDSKGWCYLGEDGYCVTSKWVKDSKGWCYVAADGYMATNKWVKDSKGWCYVGADGYCVTNDWQKDSKGWCYLDVNGRMVTSKWIKDGGKWYYLDANGYMVTGTKVIGGKTYKFASNGAWIEE